MFVLSVINGRLLFNSTKSWQENITRMKKTLLKTIWFLFTEYRRITLSHSFFPAVQILAWKTDLLCRNNGTSFLQQVQCLWKTLLKQALHNVCCCYLGPGLNTKIFTNFRSPWLRMLHKLKSKSVYDG